MNNLHITEIAHNNNLYLLNKGINLQSNIMKSHESKREVIF